MRSGGHQSKMLVLERRTRDEHVLTVGEHHKLFKYRRLAEKARLKVVSRPDSYFQNQQLSIGMDAAAIVQRLQFTPELIVVHYISHFLNADDVLALNRATGAPVIWFLLDMGLLTGGCHYAWDCTGYTRSCGDCPGLRVRLPFADLSRRTWQAKSRVIAQVPGWVLAGSGWLHRQAQQSSLFRDRHILTQLLGVSPNTFQPGDQAALRAELGAGGARRLIFFGAQKFNQRRKGMDLLLQALQVLAREWPPGHELPVLLCAGNATDFSPLRACGYHMVELGYVGTSVLAKAYAAADVFACPSIEDSGPMMINEALMSGTSVVAFRMGVAPDLILHDTVGRIAPLGDVQAFATGLQQVLKQSDDQLADARLQCRRLAMELCSNDGQAARFASIAQALVESEGRRT